MSLESLCLIVSALLELGRASEAWSKVQAGFASPAMHTPEAVNAVLRLLACNGGLLKEASEWFEVQLQIAPDAQTLSILVAGFTEALQIDKVKALLARGAECPAKTFVALVKDALKRGELTEAADYMTSMRAAGLFIPANLLIQLLRTGSKKDAEEEALRLLGKVGMSSENVASLLESCAKDQKLRLADQVLQLANDHGVTVSAACYEALVKMYAKMSDPRAFAVLDTMQAQGVGATTSLCVSVAAMCVESRNVPLAEYVLCQARMAGTANVTLFSAIVKVYAATRQFQKTCDLYTMLSDDGLVPDTIMYGGLIKAAVECGQLDLSRQLLRASGTLDIQNYMSLFRACGRERNVRKALDLLKELETSDIGIDTTAYNCVLDVCLKSGDVRQAQDLFAKMKVLGFVDVISFNTLLKGARSAGSRDALRILEDMRTLGLSPNQVTYNSVINACVSKGDLKMAWEFVAEMQRNEVEVDNFTCSIMMKGLKHSSSKDDVDQTLKLIETSRVCPDEVLVNTLLDACIRLRDVKRLTSALNTFRMSGVVPSEQSYGTLIRAYGQARCLPQAKQMWTDMLDRKVRPTEQTFTCMVEACVTNGALEDAWGTLHQLKTQIPDFATPTQIYATLLKGFAHRKETSKVLEVYAEMQAQNVKLDLVTLNCLIDACARVGDMEQASTFFREMCSSGVTPDVVTYSTIIKGYCVQGDLEQAVQLFTLMRKRGVKPDQILFNSILDGCARKQMTSMSEMMLRDMESSGVAPSNQTLQILVKMYGKAHDLETAMALAQRLPAQYGFETNHGVHSALLFACCANGRLQQAMDVFAKMPHKDARAFSTLITGCLKNADVRGAMRILEDAVRSGVQLERELVENVIFMATRRKCDGLKQLVAKLQTHGYQVQTSPLGSPRGEAAQQHSQFHARRQASQSWRDASPDSE